MERGLNFESGVLDKLRRGEYIMSQGGCQEKISAKCQLFDMLPKFAAETN